MLLYTLFVSGMLVPVQMIVLPLFVLMRDVGLLGTLFALICPYTAMGLPIGVLVLTPLVATLPRDLGDAARIDGATRVADFLRVVLPLLRPGLASVAILNGVWMWNEFFIPLMLAIKAGRADPAGRDHVLRRLVFDRMGPDLRQRGDRDRAGGDRLLAMTRQFVAGTDRRGGQGLMLPLTNAIDRGDCRHEDHQAITPVPVWIGNRNPAPRQGETDSGLHGWGE